MECKLPYRQQLLCAHDMATMSGGFIHRDNNELQQGNMRQASLNCREKRPNLRGGLKETCFDPRAQD